MHTKRYSNVHVLQVTFGQKQSWHSATSICASRGTERFKHSISPETIGMSNPRWLRLVFALPTLSADSVRECFLLTLTYVMPDQQKQICLQTTYMARTYIKTALTLRSCGPTSCAETSKPQMLVRHSTDIFNPASRPITQIFSDSWKLSRWNKIEQVSNNELKGHYQRGKRYASKEEQRASVAEKYKHGEIDIIGYLFKMPKVMQPARACRIF